MQIILYRSVVIECNSKFSVLKKMLFFKDFHNLFHFPYDD